VFQREVVFASCVLFLVTIRVVLAQSLTAKGLVYTLALLLSVLWMAAGLRTTFHPNRRIFWAAFLWGCGLAVHWPTALLWGLGLIWLVGSVDLRERPKEILRALSLCLVPLSLYLYLPFRATASVPILWGFPHDLSGFLWVVRRDLSSGTEPILRDIFLYLRSFGILMKTLCFGSVPLLAFLGLGTLVWRIVQKDPRMVWLMVSFFPVFLGILLVPRPDSFYLLDVYTVSLSGFLTLGVCLGLQSFQRWLRPALL